MVSTLLYLQNTSVSCDMISDSTWQYFFHAIYQCCNSKICQKYLMILFNLLEEKHMIGALS